MNPGVSVILPICHGGRFLRTALSTLGEAVSPSEGFEILVVGDPLHLAGLQDAVSSTVPLRFINHTGNRASALNAACAAARGEIWAFADDDCIIPRDWLLQIEHAMAQHPGAAGIGGTDLLPQKSGLFDRSLDLTLNSFAATGGIRNATSVSAGRYYPKLWNMAVRARAGHLAANGNHVFNPLLNVHEDVELADRIMKGGGIILRTPEIAVGHYRDTNFRSFLFRNFHMGQVCRSQGIHRQVHTLAAGFFTALIMAGLIAPFSVLAMWVFCVLSGCYTCMLVISGFSAAWSSRHILLVFTVPALIVSLHVSRIIGYCNTISSTRSSR